MYQISYSRNFVGLLSDTKLNRLSKLTEWTFLQIEINFYFIRLSQLVFPDPQIVEIIKMTSIEHNKILNIDLKKITLMGGKQYIILWGENH